MTTHNRTGRTKTLEKTLNREIMQICEAFQV